MLPATTHVRIAMALEPTKALAVTPEGALVERVLADGTVFEIMPSCDEVSPKPPPAEHQQLRLRVRNTASRFLEFNNLTVDGESTVRVSDPPTSGWSRCLLVGAAPCPDSVHFAALLLPEKHLSMRNGTIAMEVGGHERADFKQTSCFVFVPASDPQQGVEEQGLPPPEPVFTCASCVAPKICNPTRTRCIYSSRAAGDTSGPTGGYGANESNDQAPMTDEDRARVLSAPLLGPDSGGFDFSNGKINMNPVEPAPAASSAPPPAEPSSALAVTTYIVIGIAVLILLLYLARRYRLIDRAMVIFKRMATTKT